MNSEIIPIFATPIYKTKLNRSLTEIELSFVDKTKLDVYKNEGNTTSNNNYILDNKIFKNLKKELELKVQDYFDKVLCTTNSVTPYITQSWLNYTEKDQYHHKHQHQNSLVSGVFYISCNKNNDKIKFFHERYQLIKLKVKEWNLFNSESWWFTVESNDIVLFPSSLTHMVETKKEDSTRISLAFNVFIKGKLGSNIELTELNL